MPKNFERLFLESISFVPGIVGISNFNFFEKPKKLKEENWIKGVKQFDENNSFSISVSIIVDKDVISEKISNMIYSIFEKIASENGLNKSKINIYIRGLE